MANVFLSASRKELKGGRWNGLGRPRCIHGCREKKLNRKAMDCRIIGLFKALQLFYSLSLSLSLSLCVCVCVFFITMCVCVKCRSGILLSLVFTTPWCRLRPHHQQRPSLCVSRFKHDASLSSMVLVYISLQTLLTKAKAHGRGQQQNALQFIQPAETLRHTPRSFFFSFFCAIYYG